MRGEWRERYQAHRAVWDALAVASRRGANGVVGPVPDEEFMSRSEVSDLRFALVHHVVAGESLVP